MEITPPHIQAGLPRYCCNIFSVLRWNLFDFETVRTVRLWDQVFRKASQWSRLIQTARIVL
jgi:hypothetical protein